VVGPANLNGNILTPTAAGSLHVIAWQPGDANWSYTDPLRQTLSLTSIPSVITFVATGITTAAATLHGTVSPNGLVTTARFEYGPTTAYGSTVSVALAPSDGFNPQEVAATLASLAPGITHYRLTATNSLGTSYGADRTLATDVPAMAVEQPAHVALASGVSTSDFGSTTIGAAGNILSFTVRNTGSLPLSGLAVSVDGPGRLDYTVNAAGLPASLPAGGSGTFTIAFRPWQSGLRSAALLIAGNDPLRNPFNIALTGTGLTQPGPGQSIATTAVASVMKTSDAPFSLLAGASSGLPLTYAVLTGPATVGSNGLVTLTGAPGAVTLQTSQAGGSGYNPTATNVTFQVTLPGQAFIKVAGGRTGNHSVGIRADGTLWAWGSNITPARISSDIVHAAAA
jgi:Regulator of chromosome condensation (RCC1) repeat